MTRVGPDPPRTPEIHAARKCCTSIRFVMEWIIQENEKNMQRIEMMPRAVLLTGIFVTIMRMVADIFRVVFYSPKDSLILAILRVIISLLYLALMAINKSRRRRIPVYLIILTQISFIVLISTAVWVQADPFNMKGLLAVEPMIVPALLFLFHGCPSWLVVLLAFPLYNVVIVSLLFDYAKELPAIVYVVVETLYFLLLLCIISSQYTTNHQIQLVDQLKVSSQQALLHADEAIAAKKIAEEADHHKKEFIRYVFHEVRVPLNVMLMSIDLLGSNLDAIRGTHDNTVVQEAQSTIEQMKSSADNMMKLLDTVLSYEKISSNQITLNPGMFSIEILMKDTRNSFQSQLKSKGISLVVQIGDDIPRWVLGDAFRLGGCLGNFVSNAIKFSPPSGTITLKVEQVPHDDSIPVYLSPLASDDRNVVRLRFNVIDEGAGILPEHSHLIFEKFKQVPKEKEFEHSTGLGLNICKQIIELSAGIVGFSSAGRGKGSTFYFEVPLLATRNMESKDKDVVIETGFPSPHSVTTADDMSYSPRDAPMVHPPLSAVNRLSLSQDASSVYGSNSWRGTTVESSSVPLVRTTDTSISNKATAMRATCLHASPSECVRPNLRVLVVDDSEPTRKLMVRSIRRLGVTVSIADMESGIAALALHGITSRKSSEIMSEGGIKAIAELDLLSSTSLAPLLTDEFSLLFDLIFMDYSMPGDCDGVSTIRILREHGVKSIIVGVTGNAMMEDRVKMLDAGADAVLTKPITPAALTQMLCMGGRAKELRELVMLRAPSARMLDGAARAASIRNMDVIRSATEPSRKLSSVAALSAKALGISDV